MSRLPEELPDAESLRLTRAAEQQWAGWLCWFSPALGVLGWMLAERGLLWVLYLKPPAAFDFAAAIRWKPALAVGLAAASVPWVWRGLLAFGSLWRSEEPVEERKGLVPWGALLAVGWLVLLNLLLVHPRGRWAFVEWAKLRTPTPSFSRNTLIWDQHEFESAGAGGPGGRRIALVGSSQIYQGVDAPLLASLTPGAIVEKNCLAGFGPMQYSWLLERVLERRPQVVVCWLSEFDFFREDELPVNRLRWAASPRGLARLGTACQSKPWFDLAPTVQAVAALANWPPPADDLLSQRGALADLACAAAVPVWRLRDHLRRGVIGAWWNVSAPAAGRSADGEARLADAVADLQAARDQLARMVGRKRYVDVNFAAFEQFARALRAEGVALLVCEGTSHPEAAAAYDPSFRTETRERLTRLAGDVGFHYVPAAQLPTFAASDFADPYHLNAVGRDKFTRFLAAKLGEPL